MMCDCAVLSSRTVQGEEEDSSVEVVDQVLFPEPAKATAAAAAAAAGQRRRGPGSSSGSAASTQSGAPPAGPAKLAPLERDRSLGRGPSQSISQKPLPGGNRAPVVGMAKKSSLYVRVRPVLMQVLVLVLMLVQAPLLLRLRTLSLSLPSHGLRATVFCPLRFGRLGQRTKAP
jgi:hypothetical protein